jgi:hypothetical protein
VKNLLLADDHTVSDQLIGPPPTHRPEDLGHLLDVVAEPLESGGVLMLSGQWAAYVTPVQEAGGTQDSPVTHQAGDWRARVVEGDTWIMWAHPDKHKIWTCEVDALEPAGKDTPLVSDNNTVTALNFALWTSLTGVPWVGTPGMTGNALLVDGWREANPKAPAPRWHDSPQARWPYGNIEQPYTAMKWSREIPGGDGSVHGYDLNKAYLSAYKVAELAGNALVHHVRPEFDRKEGGIWRVSLSPWRYEHLLPDPAGYEPELEDGTRWITTPTLTLLEDLTIRGDYGGFTIHEAWTAPARRITRKWADLIDDIAGAAREPLNTAAKKVYKQTYGMWARPTRVYRPDWHYTIIAVARANLWRKIDVAYRTSPMNGALTSRTITGVGQGRVPVRIETDAVFYESQGPWESTAPPNFKLDPTGIKLGHFKPAEDKTR